ncbi:NAD(P)/FAD-dependent oxidoreductase [Pararhizobium sp. PWRC1-1]|uniref:NAD(P)/FAD-dependent oxidoreductase n=1 Tax=Pararhizobium sp. PWRC1-1 TaxID=2804566 RepID=UPI003CF2AA0A
MTNETATGQIIIVGAGECGGRAAVALRERGWKGKITIVGEETLPPYERPQLSKGFLTKKDETSTFGNADSTKFGPLEIKHLVNVKVESLDRAAHSLSLADGRHLFYDRLLLATGASARRPSIPGSELALCLRTRADADRIKARLSPEKKVIIIGGGLIGLELAASATLLGCRATLIERNDKVLSRCAPISIAGIVEARHRAEGVRFIFGTGVKSIEDRTDGLLVSTTTGSTLVADVVIAGIGAVPNVALAKAAGLAIENGISTNEFLQTSDPDIYAAGDCASTIHPLLAGVRLRLESWRSALEQGERAARNILGEDVRQGTLPWFWSDQFELCLQVVGLPQTAATTIERWLSPDALLNFHLGGEGRLVAASAVGLLNLIAKDIRVAEMLIVQSARPDPRLLAEPGYRLKTLLAA